MNIANKLTVLRIFLMPFMLWLVHSNRLFLFLPGFILAITIGFTDFLDGYLARKHNIVTDFGKFLDPVADKVFIVSILLCFLAKNYIPLWFFMIILVREIAITDFRLFAVKNKKVVNVSSLGKSKAMLQFILLFYLGILRAIDLCHASISSQTFFLKVGSYILFFVVSVLTILSMVEYFNKNKELLSDI